jgi:uncharacterized protein (TIGR03437 family)
MNVLSVLARLFLFLTSVGQLIAGDLVLPKAITNAFRISGATHAVTAVGLDAATNIYVSGGFFGAVPFTGFPVSNKTSIGPAQGYPRFFVAKFSPSGDELLYLTEIGDTDAEYDSFGGGMVVLADGSVLLSGRAGTDFATTDGSYQPKAAHGGAFLLKLDPSGQKLVFSTFLDDSDGTAANALTVGPDGSIYLAGQTNGETFPTTDTAYQQKLPMGSRPVGFISRFSSDGSKLLYSTLILDALYGIGVDNVGAIHFAGLHSVSMLDASGSRLIFSRTFNDLPTLQIDGSGNSYAYLLLTNAASPGGLLVKFDPTGAVQFEKSVPGVEIGLGRKQFVVLDDGSIVFAGFTFYVDFKTRNTLQPCDMNLLHHTIPAQWSVRNAALVVLEASGNVVNSSFLGGTAPPGFGTDANGFAVIAKGTNGTVVLAGSSFSLDFPGGLLLIPGDPTRASFAFTLDLGALPQDGPPAPACLALPASSRERAVEAPVVPAMFMSLFGSGLGPATTVYSQLDSTQRLPMELAGVSLTVGGIQMPILSVQDGQIDFIAPHDISGPTTEVCVSRNGVEACLFAYVGDQDGTILPGILNEDGTVNSPTNPAAQGSVVSLFGIGFGIFDPAIPDGALAAEPFQSSGYSVRASLARTFNAYQDVHAAAEVLYVGTAPQLLNGVVQINLRIWAISGPTMISVQGTGGTIPAYPLLIPPTVVFVK